VEETFPRLLSFDPSQAPAVRRDAATAVVTPAGRLEVFCDLRHQRSSFLGGAERTDPERFVGEHPPEEDALFPGGPITTRAHAPGGTRAPVSPVDWSQVR
jgi:hypothetical protein